MRAAQSSRATTPPSSSDADCVKSIPPGAVNGGATRNPDPNTARSAAVSVVGAVGSLGSRPAIASAAASTRACASATARAACCWSAPASSDAGTALPIP